MSQKAFIVIGTTGEYSDACEWPVVAYAFEEAAEEHAQKANDWAEEQGVYDYTSDYGELSRTLRNPYDPNMQLDYTGVCYYVERAVPSRINSVRPITDKDLE